MKNKKPSTNFQFQKIVAWVGVLLFIIKFLAWYVTSSVAILTDMLESVVNVASGFIGLYSLYISALPKDKNHPYGHGKIEFISAAIEGILISIAGLVIIYESIYNFWHPHTIAQIDLGLILVSVSALVNYIMGYYAIQKGKSSKSLALEASGKHLQSDTYTTLGLIGGLGLIYFTNWVWVDSVVAFIFAVVIIITGYRIIRDALAGIMDEQDVKLVQNLVEFLQRYRKNTWIDLHNLRIIKYGGVLHIDCHLTLPWYINVESAHQEQETLGMLVKTYLDNQTELFVHIDPCTSQSCSICNIEICEKRKCLFSKQIEWTVENLSINKKHIE